MTFTPTSPYHYVTLWLVLKWTSLIWMDTRWETERERDAMSDVKSRGWTVLFDGACRFTSAVTRWLGLVPSSKRQGRGCLTMTTILSKEPCTLLLMWTFPGESSRKRREKVGGSMNLYHSSMTTMVCFISDLVRILEQESKQVIYNGLGWQLVIL